MEMNDLERLAAELLAGIRQAPSAQLRKLAIWQTCRIAAENPSPIMDALIETIIREESL